MVPRLGPPKHLKSLRIFVDPPDVAAALARVEPLMGRCRTLLQVRYGPGDLTPENGQAHTGFLQRFPAVAGYLPFCLPGTPRHAELAPFTTPAACDTCIFREGRACPGLHGEGYADATTPLRADVQGGARADFIADPPVAWWMPTETHLRALTEALRGRRVWDIGGANGYLAARLAERGIDVTVVDPVPWPTPHGVRRVVADVRDFAGTRWLPSSRAGRDGLLRDSGERPDALITSWPPTGDGFRDVIEALQPAVLVTAGDADGFCGCHPGHAAVVATAEGLQWFGWPRGDGRWPGLRLRQTWRVHTPHDMRAERVTTGTSDGDRLGEAQGSRRTLRRGGPPGGILRIYARPPEAV